MTKNQHFTNLVSNLDQKLENINKTQQVHRK